MAFGGVRSTTGSVHAPNQASGCDRPVTNHLSKSDKMRLARWIRFLRHCACPHGPPLRGGLRCHLPTSANARATMSG